MAWIPSLARKIRSKNWLTITRNLARAALTALGIFATAPVFFGDTALARGPSVIAGESPGTIVVSTSARRLYLITGNGTAISYPVGVGRLGKQWAGTSYINGKYRNPAWSPPAEIRRDRPGLPYVIPGGSPRNPMGVAAMTLADGEYAIHGTNAPGSIGGFVSYGCIRMHNRDILDLYERVGVGTRVVVKR